MRNGFCKNCNIETDVSLFLIQTSNLEFDVYLCDNCKKKGNMTFFGENFDFSNNETTIIHETNFYKLIPKSMNHFQILQKFIF